MALLLSGCSTSSNVYQMSPVQNSFVCQGKDSCIGNQRWAHFQITGRSRFNSCMVQDIVCMPRTFVCRVVGSLCIESEIADKEEARVVSSWKQDDSMFSMGNKSDNDQMSLRKSVIRKDVAVETRSDPSLPKLEKKVEHPSTKLHFLEERDEEILSRRLLNLSRSNKVRSAVELFASMEACDLRPNAHACNSLLSSLIRNKSLTDALRIFEVMRKKDATTAHTCSLMLKAVAGAKGYHAAIKMFNALEQEDSSRKTFDVVVYNTMLSMFAKAKDWMEAEKMWRKIEQSALRGTFLTYDLLISTFVQCGQAELAVGAYHEMLGSGLNPNEDIMKAIVASCTKEGKWKLALTTFRRMLSTGTKPNIISFNSIINALGKGGEVELAFRMHHLMISLGLQPDAYTWNALLSGLYRSNRFADALQFFEGIKAKHPLLLNSHLYNIALMSCGKLGLFECALQLLWEMERTEMQMSAVSYNHVIYTCEVAKTPKVALQVYRHMIHRRCSPDTFTYLSLIRSCIWGSLWTEIEDILEEVQLDAAISNVLIHGLCIRGKIKLAKRLYAKIHKIGLEPASKTSSLSLQQSSKSISEIK